MSAKNHINNISSHNGTEKRTSCVVLRYQRIALLSYDILQTAVQPYLFESQMEYLAGNCNLISIHELIDHLRENRKFEKNSVAVTFDGGYSDIYYTAKKVLEDYQIPVTVFAHTANISGETEKFWWDELEDLIVANTDRQNLDIRIEGENYSFSLVNQHSRFYAYEKLYELLKDMSPEQQKDIIEQIKEQLEFKPAEVDNHRLMDKNEISKLSKNQLFSIGGHGHSGATIYSIEKEKKNEEIIKNKRILEKVTDSEIEYFSYPLHRYLTRQENEETQQILKDCGFKAAFGHNYGVVTCEELDYLFDIPRIKAGNFHPFTFYQLFERFFG